MALSKPTIEASIESAFVSAYGAPVDPLEFAKFKGALATALLDILTTQVDVTVVSNGADVAGDPIVNLPGTGTLS